MLTPANVTLSGTATARGETPWSSKWKAFCAMALCAALLGCGGRSAGKTNPTAIGTDGHVAEADGGADSAITVDVEAGTDGSVVGEAESNVIDAAFGSGIDAAPLPHCAPGGPGLSNCGATNESCCTSLTVTGGTFYRTYANDGTGPTEEADPATISSFRLDKYDVTVGRYRQFVNAWNAGWIPAAGSGKHAHLNGGNGLNATEGGYEPGWVSADDSNIALTNANLDCGYLAPGQDYSTWTPAVGAQENLPINCLSWYESYAFCIWDGGFLPSAAEMEYAGVGGNQQRQYPWGSAGGAGVNQYVIYACNYPNGDGLSFSASTYQQNPLAVCTGVANIAPVGTAALGAGLWGQLDLAGNVFEWNLDWAHAPYVDPCIDCTYLTPSPAPCPNCAGPPPPPARVTWGSCYGCSLRPLSSEAFNSFEPEHRQNVFGVRCGRAP
jgi:sulfatase modifying factor 1